MLYINFRRLCFNTQPPEGGWFRYPNCWTAIFVSTHSRLKAAGSSEDGPRALDAVSTHSRLKAAGVV